MDLDVSMGKAIQAAICHVRDIAVRPFMNMDRVERVCQFVTSLRREMSMISGDITQNRNFRILKGQLCDKHLWFDAGILWESGMRKTFFTAVDMNNALGMVDKERIQKWSNYANAAVPQEDELVKTNRSLDQLLKETECFAISVGEIRTINSEVDDVMKKLSGLLVGS